MKKKVIKFLDDCGIYLLTGLLFFAFLIVAQVIMAITDPNRINDRNEGKLIVIELIHDNHSFLKISEQIDGNVINEYIIHNPDCNCSRE